MADEPAFNDGTALRDYLRVARRRRWLILQAVVIVPLLAVLLSLRQERLYEASAKVLLTRENLSTLLSNVQDPSLYQPADRVAQTQATLARVPAVAQATLRAAGIRDLTVDEFLERSSVSAEANADILDFHVTATSPERARLLASAYAEQYVTYEHASATRAVRRAQADVRARIGQLRRAGQTGSALYDSLVEKAQQLATLEALQTANALVVEAAGRSMQVQPRPLRNGILGLVLGLALGVGLALLVEALDTRVRTADEVSERLRLPLLGRVPPPGRRLERERQLVMVAEPGSPYAEAFRLLRTNVEFATLDRPVRSLMITSAVQGEGKSTTISNLAVAFARTGRRVILVDLDFRCPTVGSFFPLGADVGVSDVALGHASLECAVRDVALSASPDDHAREGSRNGSGGADAALAVLPAGATPPDPGEFVGSSVLASILDRLAGEYDLVLIDAPPLLSVGDALSLSRRVDAIVVMARLELLRRPMLDEMRRLLTTSPSSKLGWVMAAIGEQKHAYASYHYRAPQVEEVQTRRTPQVTG